MPHVLIVTGIHKFYALTNSYPLAMLTVATELVSLRGLDYTTMSLWA